MNYLINKITLEGINIDEYISFKEEYLKLSTIKALDNVHVLGRLYLSITNEIIFQGLVEGIMKLQDAYSGDLLDYSFNIEIDEVVEDLNKINEETVKNKQNTLDLKEVLWENIVLEVPIATSKENGVKKLKGEGWEIRDENSKKEDSRLECFKALLKEGKE